MLAVLVKTPLAVTKRDLQKILTETPFLKGYRFRLHSVEDGMCRIRVPFRKAFERPGGMISGPVYMAAADVAMWLAIMTRLGVNDPSVTRST